jgi:hypothetical protein
MPPHRTADDQTEELPPRSRKTVSSGNDTLDGEQGFLWFCNKLPRRCFLFSVASKRPRRINRGQGGAIAQLEAISEQISENKRQKKPGRKDILTDIPVNVMAPSGDKTVS